MEVPTESFVDVIALSELAMGGQHVVLVNGRRILLCRVEEGVFALADLCPHAQQPLAGGVIAGNMIRCPRHGACFDIASGLPLNAVTRMPVKIFPVRERQGRVEVSVPAVNQGYFPNFGKAT